MRVATRRHPRVHALRRALTGTTLTLAVALSGCGDNATPFADQPQGEDGAPLSTTDVTTSPATPITAPQTTTPATNPATTPPAASSPPAASTPGTSAADAPSPNGATPDAATKAGKRPHSLSERVEADNTAKLGVRTMVSIIEGCHSGRETYKSCNTHKELGSPALLGLTIGKARGEIQISATDNGFRITAHSMSGAKFTVARGPSGDRFKCISGPMPGACPADRAWSF